MAQGSFSFLTTAKTGDALVLRFEGSKESTVFTVLGDDIVLVTPPPEAIPGVPPVTPPAAGKTTVRGRTSPNLSLFGVNMASGEVATARSLADGVFQLELAGQSGEILRVYNDETPLGVPWPLIIP